MNARIELVSECCVWITAREGGLKIRLVLGRDGILVWETNGSIAFDKYLQMEWDDAGRAALIDALQCHKDTGSFAALADTSAIPYTGKRMRRIYESDDKYICEVTVIGKGPNGDWVSLNEDDEGFAEEGEGYKLLPLAPAPPEKKYRAYTHLEAAQHLGRTAFLLDNKSPWTVGSVSLEWARFDENGYVVLFERMVRDCTWADDGSPCGTLVESEA